MHLERKKAYQIIFVIVVILGLLIGVSYGSGLLFFYIHHMPTDQVHPFTIWECFLIYKSSPIKFVRITVICCAFAPYILLIAGLFLLLKKQPRSLHGAARFASLNEVKAAGLIDPKDGLDRTILVGKFKDKYLTYGGYQFVMLAAPTRSGKGVGVVIPNCLNYSDSLVVLDIKLENFDISAGFRAAHGQEVFLFSPFDIHGRTHRYNPLEYISNDEAERIGDIDAIAAALYSGDEKDKFWTENAKDLFRGLCLLVLETPSLPKTFGEILRQASGKGKSLSEHIEDMLKTASDNGQPYSSACTDALNRVTNASENTLAGIVATFNTPLLIFQNPRVDMATSANDFDLRDVRKKKMTIYLGVTPDKLKDASVLINLFFDQLLNLNTRTLPQQDPSLKYQCLLILDEFTSIGRINMIQQAISYQAGYNMRVLTIIQNKSQLEDKYGKAGAITLMANHALMIMYAPSPVVQSDANEYSEMLGYETVKSTNKSRSTSGAMTGSSSSSESVSDQKRALMLPQEIKELGRWKEIVSLENCKPILCDKIKYFEDPNFIARTKFKVPQIPVHDVHLFMKNTGLLRESVEAQTQLAEPNKQQQSNEQAINQTAVLSAESDNDLNISQNDLQNIGLNKSEFTELLDGVITDAFGNKTNSEPVSNTDATPSASYDVLSADQQDSLCFINSISPKTPDSSVDPEFINSLGTEYKPDVKEASLTEKNVLDNFTLETDSSSDDTTDYLSILNKFGLEA